MRDVRDRFVVYFLVLLTGCLRLYGQTPDSSLDKWRAIGAENYLANQDAGSFYLKVEFEIYDLNGDHPETGTLEEWKSGSRVKRIISSPSWNYPQSPDHQVTKNRSAYLISDLLRAIMDKKTQPAVPSTGTIKEAQKTFGSLTLDCLALETQDGVTDTTCLDPETHIWRLDQTSDKTVVRNHIGEFRAIPVSLSVSIFFEGRLAIKGTITALHGIDATDAHLPAEPPSADSPNADELQVLDNEKNAGDIHLSPRLTVGSIIVRVPPQYPEVARMRHIGGTVVLQGMIEKTGSVSSLVVMASPDSSLSQAAMAAVGQWRYKPFLLDGKPVQVDTEILVNFNINHH